MPGNLPVPAGLEVVINWTIFATGNPRALNVLHFQQAPVGAVNQARADAIDTLIKGVFSTSGLVGCISPGIALGFVTVRDMQANTNPAFIGNGGGVAGTATGDQLPPQIALVVTHNTGARGKSFHGRSYLFGLTEQDNQATGVVGPACLTAAAAFFNAIRTSMSPAPQSSAFSVLSRFTTPPGSPPHTPATERPVPILTPVVTSLCRDNVFDTQRRRVT